jgi:hypothetical protein
MGAGFKRRAAFLAFKQSTWSNKQEMIRPWLFMVFEPTNYHGTPVLASAISERFWIWSEIRNKK